MLNTRIVQAALNKRAADDDEKSRNLALGRPAMTFADWLAERANAATAGLRDKAYSAYNTVFGSSGNSYPSSVPPSGIAQPNVSSQYLRSLSPSGEPHLRPITKEDKGRAMSHYTDTLSNIANLKLNVGPFGLFKARLIPELDYTGEAPVNAPWYKRMFRGPIGTAKAIVGEGQRALNKGVSNWWDKNTLSGGAPSPVEYGTYKRWSDLRTNSMPDSQYEGRIPQTPNALPNGNYIRSDLK